MTVTAEYAAQHFSELANAAAQGDDVCITDERGIVLNLRVQTPEPLRPAPVLDENGFRVLGLGRAHLRRPLTQADLDEMDRDWQENVIDKLWMNSDEE